MTESKIGGNHACLKRVRICNCTLMQVRHVQMYLYVSVLLIGSVLHVRILITRLFMEVPTGTHDKLYTFNGILQVCSLISANAQAHFNPSKHGIHATNKDRLVSFTFLCRLNHFICGKSSRVYSAGVYKIVR